MTLLENRHEVIRELCRLRQDRRFLPEPVPAALLNELLEVARWTGSWKNTQPWHFVVVDDKELLQELSTLHQYVHWIAGAPLVIALVLDERNETGEDYRMTSKAYDEGRVTERLMFAARLLGLGGGTAWFASDESEKAAKELLGVPADRRLHSVVAIGYPDTSARKKRPTGGRKPLAELVSYNRFGEGRG